LTEVIEMVIVKYPPAGGIKKRPNRVKRGTK